MDQHSLSDSELLRILSIFADKASETILITDGDLAAPDGPTILYINEKIERDNGYTARELVDRKRIGVFYPPGVMERVLEQLREAARTGESVTRELVATVKAGKSIALEVSTIPVLDAGGRTTHFVRIGRDITARKRIEAERETTQRLLASVFGAIEQALCVLDDTNRFLMVNTAVTRQLGWSVFDLLGKPLATVIDPADRAAVERELSNEDSTSCRISIELLHRNGDARPGEIVLTTILQPGGRQYRSVLLLPQLAAAVDKSFERAVQQALRGRGKQRVAIAGKLQMVGLAEVRGVLGDRWPAVAERSFRIAERILHRHLGATDVATRTADDGFVVCFAELGEAEAQFKARVIGEEIREKLVGEFPEMANTQVTSFAATVPMAEEEVIGEDNLASALESRLARERERVELAALEQMRSKLSTAEARFQTLRTETNQRAPILLARLPPDLEQAQTTLLNLGHRDFVPQTELLLLAGAAERVLAGLNEDATDLIVTRVRLATLVHRRESIAWLQLARSMGWPEKQRLVLEIAEFDRDTARTRLSDVARMLAPLFRAIACELPTSDPAFLSCLPPATPLATLDVRLLGDSPGPQVARLLKALAPMRCRLIIKNVPSSALAVALARSGVSLIGMANGN